MHELNDLRILIIDDNADIHRDFMKVLSTEKKDLNKLDELKLKILSKNETHSSFPAFRIDSATQGEEGVSLIEAAMQKNDRYALAFVDVRMPPGIDGIKTIEKIWNIDPDVQIVICTAYSDYSWEKMVQKLGERENLLVLKKPFDSVAVRQISMALTKKWILMHESRDQMNKLEIKVKERTHELEYQATHDSLTGLPNRQSLINFLENCIAESERNMTLFAVLFIDIDRFKLINDSFSHSIGDELLKQFSKRLENNLRQMDFLARLGGDEFIVILRDITHTELVLKIVEKLLFKLGEKFQLDNHDVFALPSMGVSLFPYNGKTVDMLLKNADLAMYQSKEKGGNQIQFYSDELNMENIERLELEVEMHNALKNNEFYLCYQPQFNCDTKKLLSVEALIRWRHPTRGDLLPIDFVPLAEETGLFISIGEWVLRRACLQNKQWQDKGLEPFKVAVNITTHQFMQSNLVEMIDAILKETKLDPKYLELELSENIVIKQSCVEQMLPRLKKLGVSLAIDDFGTGYSSLSYLKKIPLDKLKIDRSFVKNIDLNKSDEVIIQAIITMAKSLNLEVTAEGVETKQQLAFLKENACPEIQGYFFSKPLKSEELERFLGEEHGHD